MSFLDVVKSIRAYKRELWAMIILKILLSYSYFCLSSRLVVYLSNDHGYSDQEASDIYGVWGISMSIIQFFAGPIIDRLQIRRSLITGSLINSLGMFIIALTFDMKTLLLFALFIVMPAGTSLGLAVVDIGGKKFAPPQKGSLFMSQSLLYSAMNIGAAITGITIEYVQQKFGEEGIRYGEYHATSDRIMILIGAVATAMAGLIAALTVNDDVQTQRDLELANVSFPGTVPNSNRSRNNNNDDDDNPQEVAPPARRCCWRVPAFFYWIKADVFPVLRNTMFRVLLLLSLITIGVKVGYRQIDSLLPKVIIRKFGSSNHYGALYTLNPLMIIFIVPPIAAFLSKYNIYNSIILGTFLSGGSMFILSSEFTWVSLISWSLLFTFGEAIYSPLMNVFFMAVAPDGREGLYQSLVYAPNLLAKAVSGPYSGYLLDNYCPKDGPYDECNQVWYYVGLVTMTTPILLIVFYKVIYNDTIKVRIRQRLLDEGIPVD